MAHSHTKAEVCVYVLYYFSAFIYCAMRKETWVIYCTCRLLVDVLPYRLDPGLDFQ